MKWDYFLKIYSCYISAVDADNGYIFEANTTNEAPKAVTVIEKESDKATKVSQSII